MSLYVLVVLFYCLNVCSCTLWSKGVVHFSINQKDYDLHSQDVILSTFSRLQDEVCVKFFNTPTNYTPTEREKLLYISNPDKVKDCPPRQYDYSGNVIDMPIGYRCLNPKDITRLVGDMLRASIAQTVPIVNSYDLVKKFGDRENLSSKSGLLSSEDKNYINAHYHAECGTLTQPVISRRAGNDAVETPQMTEDNVQYYGPKLWPLGVVMYATHPDIEYDDPDLKALHHAMATIELGSCVVFQRAYSLDVLEPKNFLWLSNTGEDMPEMGFMAGNQGLRVSHVYSLFHLLSSCMSSNLLVYNDDDDTNNRSACNKDSKNSALFPQLYTQCLFCVGLTSVLSSQLLQKAQKSPDVAS
ncbi:hypothetical protein evm_008168 [Chilo suppressalis]|nr:hypothetical protein evm_008168 [Chilo suppressalis]